MTLTMWARKLWIRPGCLPRTTPRTIPRMRHIQQQAGSSIPHTTYFAPPQPPKRPRSILRGILLTSAGFLLGAFTYGYLIDIEIVELDADGEVLNTAVTTGLMADGLQSQLAVHGLPLTMSQALEILKGRSSIFIGEKSIAHVCQLPSNLPCEDTWVSGTFNPYDWECYAIFDGHAGPQTATFLAGKLPGYVAFELWHGMGMQRAYAPNDKRIVNIIKKAFISVDRHILELAENLVETDLSSRTEAVGAAGAAFSGSCALMALFDHARSVLRVMNVGDSRAVLGRWDDEAQAYTAKEMSTDHKGFNASELARINKEHPEEDVVDPRTGRVHGIAITRAFGDSRWKWTEELTERAHKLIWGPLPRPNGVIKTPPYLTAEPEVTETTIRAGPKPDFLIMASDGLWDLMSSEDAVECVQMWLAAYKPAEALETGRMISAETPTPSQTMVEPLSPEEESERPPLDDADEDTYYNEEEKTLQWRVSPKHFVVENDHCGIHLIRNALGGKRRGLFTSAMSVQPPLSRNARDDITVQVIFFGQSKAELVQKGIILDHPPTAG